MIHKEGRATILLSMAFAAAIIFITWFFAAPFTLIPLIVFSALLGLVIQFFRNPYRPITNESSDLVFAPADGKVVVIEETEENEYFKDKRLQVSIFMSPLNVHVNRNPISGSVNYIKYHPGKYFVAWNPKSSTENERTTVVLQNNKTELLIRQIAGAMARRIVNYLQVGQEVTQGTDMGFIKFGSRVDVFFPLGTDIQVKLDEMVKGNETVLARL